MTHDKNDEEREYAEADIHDKVIWFLKTDRNFPICTGKLSYKKINYMHAELKTLAKNFYWTHRSISVETVKTYLLGRNEFLYCTNFFVNVFVILIHVSQKASILSPKWSGKIMLFVIFVCRKRQLNYGDPSDENAITEALCHNRYGTINIPSSPNAVDVKQRTIICSHSPSPYEQNILIGKLNNIIRLNMCIRSFSGTLIMT